MVRGFARAVAQGARQGGLTLIGLAGLCVLALTVWADRAGRPRDASAPLQPAGESYALPITSPQDQGDTGLCWVFATLSMLETNYMSRHPGAEVEFSRAGLQRDAVDDRARRRARGEPGSLSEGGLAVEAVDLVRRNGLVQRADFHDIVNIEPLVSTLKETLEEAAEPAEKERDLDDDVEAALGEKPVMTHLNGRPVSPAELARMALGGSAWVEFDLSRDGATGWGPSRDPDARAETRVRYVTIPVLIDLIHRSLRRGEAAVVGTIDHALLVYGADYDPDGKPLSYLIKDSLAPPYLYRLDAEALHQKLNDVTVAVERSEPDFAESTGSAEKVMPAL